MRSVKMQRALEVCVEYAGQGGLAYRKAWAEKAGFERAYESPSYIGVKDGEFWVIEGGEYVSQYTPSAEDATASDWDYEF